MPDTLLDRLCGRLDVVRRSPMAEAVVAKTRDCLVDYLAALCAGLGSATTSAAGQAAAAFGPGECTLAGLSRTGAPAGAALYNGLLAHAEELDDSHRYVSGLHLGCVIFPALLALAEAEDSPGPRVFRAALCGYEAAGRICRCMDAAHRARGFHATGTVGSFGAAAACAVLLDLDATQLKHALGLAASTSAGVFAFLEDGATVKHLHAGRAALDGLLCALLAAGGLRGPAAVFEAREGFFHAYAGEFDPTPLDADLGGAEVLCAYHKLHSACGHTFPAIDAALALRSALHERGLEPGSLRSLEYRTYAAAAALRGREPATPAQARFALPFILAVALLHGKVTRAELAPGCLQNPEVLAVSRKVQLREDRELCAAFPRLRAGILTAVLPDGETLSFRVDTPRGMPDNPVRPEELERKLRNEAATVLPAASVEELVRLAAGAAEAASLRPLTALLRSARMR